MSILMKDPNNQLLLELKFCIRLYLEDMRQRKMPLLLDTIKLKTEKSSVGCFKFWSTSMNTISTNPLSQSPLSSSQNFAAL
eukprot:TRINITY_DN4982_c0_g1_i1.p1 TRINITY_DN4982_c0_g1~~TRINITY_DN4982_c0_g1_i1.p1  ORF type:complete len:81 (-),score=7.98 TRINITY_DN4982_c0_g1_i1:172-414(-)